MSEEWNSKAEEGRAAFHAMLHCFNETNKTMQALGSQYERVARAMENQVMQKERELDQNQQMMLQQRKVMEYMAALQGQIRVLCEVIASENNVLPELPDAPGALIQSLLQQGIQHGIQHGLHGGY